MSADEIRQTVADYARAARNAVEAGFDGVEILRQLSLLARSVPEPHHQSPQR
jgi:N-ethylmaleimide reductase